MILYPAIDLKEGRCVRLRQGDMAQATIFNDDPAAQAASFEADGFRWLHVVDLDGAFAGKPVNAAAVDAILARVRFPCSSAAASATWRPSRAGSRRASPASSSARRPCAIRISFARPRKAYPGKVAVGIDARGGMVAVEGWAETSTLSALDLGRRFEDAGVAAIVYTDIARDGMLQGLDMSGTRALAESLSIPVIASGGLASIADVEALLAPENRRIAGAITGRALYDGRLDAKAALSLIERTAAA